MITTLKDYFQPGKQARALDAYRQFAEGSAWSVPMKMDLYRTSREAFDPAAPADQGFKSFQVIYDNLVSYWQVFRPHGARGSWSTHQIFEKTKKEFSQFAWEGSVTLPNLMGSGKHQLLLFALMEMEGIKPNKGYPIMAVSKFLHFFNPSLFPIYDTEVIWNRVFKRFKVEFGDFCSASNLDSEAGDVAFLRNYVCWGSSLLASAHSGFMSVFTDWLGNELPQRKFHAIGRELLSTLYATAFEFTAIGAAMAEGY